MKHTRGRRRGQRYCRTVLTMNQTGASTSAAGTKHISSTKHNKNTQPPGLAWKKRSPPRPRRAKSARPRRAESKDMRLLFGSAIVVGGCKQRMQHFDKMIFRQHTKPTKKLGAQGAPGARKPRALDRIWRKEVYKLKARETEWCELMFSLLQSNAFGLAARWEQNWKHIFCRFFNIGKVPQYGFHLVETALRRLLKLRSAGGPNLRLACCCFSCLLRRAWKNKQACRNKNGRFKGHPGCKYMATQNSCIASASRPRQSEDIRGLNPGTFQSCSGHSGLGIPPRRVSLRHLAWDESNPSKGPIQLR